MSSRASLRLSVFSLGSDLLGTANSLFGARGGGDHRLFAEVSLNDAVDLATQLGLGAEYSFRNFGFLRVGKKFYNDDRVAEVIDVGRDIDSDGGRQQHRDAGKSPGRLDERALHDHGDHQEPGGRLRSVHGYRHGNEQHRDGHRRRPSTCLGPSFGNWRKPSRAHG